MTNDSLFAFPELLRQVAAMLPPDTTVYLVGGAVRDALLGREIHDFDFVLNGDALQLARKLGDRLGAAYYPLDEKREIGRLVFISPGGSRYMLDFARIQGPDLENDLRARDFTINAMALDVRQPYALFDPLGGAADLQAKKLRACSPTAFLDDPVRILRAIRQAAAYKLSIVSETRQWMREATPRLPSVSPERLRDELFRILEGPQPAACLRALDVLNALPAVLPELSSLKNVMQSPPHRHDVWNHTLDVLQRLDTLLDALSPEYDPDAAANLLLGLTVLRLGRFRQEIGKHLKTFMTPDRSLRPLLFLAALYHDIAKPQTLTIDEQGRTRFFNHDQVGAQIAAARARALRLSNLEIERVKKIVQHHMRPLLLAQSGRAPTRRAVYRFYRDAGAAGIDICLLSLADALATQGAALPADDWARHLDVVRALFEAWWETPEKSISPAPLLRGDEIMKELHLAPGPHIRWLLDAIREAQVCGQLSERAEAIEFARKLLEHPIETDSEDE